MSNKIENMTDIIEKIYQGLCGRVDGLPTEYFPPDSEERIAANENLRYDWEDAVSLLLEKGVIDEEMSDKLIGTRIESVLPYNTKFVFGTRAFARFNNGDNEAGRDFIGLTIPLPNNTIKVYFSMSGYEGLNSDKERYEALLHEICHAIAFYQHNTLNHEQEWLDIKEKVESVFMDKSGNKKLNIQVSVNDIGA